MRVCLVAESVGCCRTGFHVNFTWESSLEASESSLSMSVTRIEVPWG